MSYRMQPRPLEGETGRYALHADLAWCSWNGFYGGALLGAMIEAATHRSGKPLFSASAQFVSNVARGDDLRLDCEPLAEGKSVAQYRVTAMRGETRLASSSLVMALRPPADPVLRMPEAPAPEDCPARGFLSPIPGGLNETMDVRTAIAQQPVAAVWARCPAAAGSPLTPALLSAYADHPPFGVAMLFGGAWYGITLDATLRVFEPPRPRDGADWVLVEMRFDGLSRDAATATSRLWAREGELLCIATQTMRVREGISGKR